MREQACQRALTEKRTLCGAAVHSRLVISVFLRTAASTVTPSTPMRLSPRLQGVGGSSERAGACQRALTQERTLGGEGAHLSEVTALPLSPSHSLMMPSAV